MSIDHSTTAANSGKSNKPAKPYPDFPLTAHSVGQWCKKIRGKIHYFGPWADPDGALEKYLAQKDDLHAGRTRRPDPDALTVEELANRFLAQRQSLVDSGELTALTWGDYKSACDEIMAAFGKGRLVSDLRPDDFAALRTRLAAKWGHHRVSKTIQFVRCTFKYAYDPEWVMVGRDSVVVGQANDPAQDFYDSTVLLDLWHIVRLEPLEATAPIGDQSNGK